MKFRDISELSGPSNFIKLKDGESVAGICRGELEEGFVLWENRVKTPVPEGTPGAKFSFRVNFVVKEGTSYVAKVLEGGIQIYKQLAALSAQWELPETVIYISREGSGPNDTEYTVMPAPPKQQVTKEALEFIAAMELNDLSQPQEPPKANGKVKNHAPGAKF